MPNRAANNLQAALDAHGRLTIDRDCVGCGYNVRGLDHDGQCPECGMAVARSVHGDELRFADPQWLAVVCGGLRWIRITLASALIAFLLLMVGSTVTTLIPAASVDSFSTFSLIVAVIGLLISLVLPVTLAWGVWRLCRQEPKQLSREPSLSWRNVTRFVTPVAIALCVGYTASPATATLMTMIWWIVTMLVLGVAAVALLSYLAALARRIPAPDQGQRLRRLRRETVLVLGCVLLINAVELAVWVGVVQHIPPSSASWINRYHGNFESCMNAIIAIGTLYLAIAYPIAVNVTARKIDAARRAGLELTGG